MSESFRFPSGLRRVRIKLDENFDARLAAPLEAAGHDVRTAYDGETALALARLQLPEVVICDLSMPGISGFELARQLRQDLGLLDSLLVAVSGYNQEDDRRRSQESGFNAHFAKPVCIDSLKAMLANMDPLAAGSPGVPKAAVATA